MLIFSLFGALLVAGEPDLTLADPINVLDVRGNLHDSFHLIKRDTVPTEIFSFMAKSFLKAFFIT